MKLNYVKNIEMQKKILEEVYDDFDDRRYFSVIAQLHDDIIDVANEVFVDRRVRFTSRFVCGKIRRITYHVNKIVFIVYMDDGTCLALNFDDVEFL